MAKCTGCDREMSLSDGCNVKKMMIGGQFYKRIRVGDPSDVSEGKGTANRCLR